MSRKGNMFNNNNKRGISKITWVVIGGAVFLLVIFPYYGNYLRSLIFNGFYQLRVVGVGCFFIGMALAIGGVFLKPLRKSKVIIGGIILVLVGLALDSPTLLISLFTGSGGTRGYHFLV